MNRESILAACSLFADLSPAHLRELGDTATARSVPRKSILFVENDPGRSLFVLGAGLIQLHKTAEDGSETIIKLVHAGESFGEVILFEQPNYPVTATALADSELLALPREAVLALLRNEDFRNDFIAALLRRQRYLAQRLHDMTSLDVEERFFRFLREHFGAKQAIEIGISKKDVAAAIGATPETLSRLLLRLEQEGRLSWEGHRITINAD